MTIKSEMHSYVIQCDSCGWYFNYKLPYLPDPPYHDSIAKSQNWEIRDGRYICQKCVALTDTTEDAEDISRSEDADEYDESYGDDDD